MFFFSKIELLKQLYILGGTKFGLNLLSLSEEYHGKTSF